MAAWQVLSALLASSLEALAIVEASRGDAAAALACHAAACLATALGLGRALLPEAGWWGLALLAGTSFFLPLLGPLGFAGLAWALPARSGLAPARCIYTAVPPPVWAPTAAGGVRALGRLGGEARVAFLVATQADGQAAVQLLRLALRDPDEEVRLLAHARLENATRAAWRRIDALTRRAASTGSPDAALQLRLGAEHWELVRQGLVEGEIRQHVLDCALRHLNAARLGEGHRPSLHYLLGRVHLARGDGQQAETALWAARAAGMSVKTMAPWLAEAAFVSRRQGPTEARS
jgi:hypothetical protein